MTVKKTIEVGEFGDLWAFLPSLGGAISLYLGTSLIALFEILEFIIRLAFSLVAFCFWKISQTLLHATITLGWAIYKKLYTKNVQWSLLIKNMYFLFEQSEWFKSLTYFIEGFISYLKRILRKYIYEKTQFSLLKTTKWFSCCSDKPFTFENFNKKWKTFDVQDFRRKKDGSHNQCILLKIMISFLSLYDEPFTFEAYNKKWKTFELKDFPGLKHIIFE